MQTLPLEPIYIDELTSLYREENRPAMAMLKEFLAPKAELIAEHFYQVMLDNDDTAAFLSNEDVQLRLKLTMVAWIRKLFYVPKSEAEIRNIIQQQIQVGNVHARIDLPMNLVNFGARTLKMSMTKQLMDSDLTTQHKTECLCMVNQLMDTMVALINESYVNNIVINEKNAQAFRMHVTSKVLAFDCERLRSSLLDWMRDLLSNLCNSNVDRATFITLRKSDFGLWLIHKGELILVGRSELPVLVNFVSVADELLQEIVELPVADKSKLNELLAQLNEEVTKVIWLLGSISKEMLDIDSGRDSLTNLFNRRYVPTVLLHETECSIKTGIRYGVLYADIDNFKVLNDTYGHNNGDTILKQFSAILSQHARAGDFVFRYGGEEFLIIVADIFADQLPDIAEKIRKAVEETAFRLLNDVTIPVTVSIGAAVHDGHRDYERTIRNADDALYKAKESGRNCVEVFI